MAIQYISPTYAVVEIKNNDVIATSTVQNLVNEVGFIYGGGWNGYARSAGRPFEYEDIYQGY